MQGASSMQKLKYLAHYPPQLVAQAEKLLHEQKLSHFLLEKYPLTHQLSADKMLYDYAIAIKNAAMRTAPPLSKVVYDDKIHVINHALGLHSFVSRVQGGKLKAKHEIRISSLFRCVPLAFLRMILVHELAHLKHKAHDKAFYQLCVHMEPEYHQLEFDLRLYLTYLEQQGTLYHQRHD